MLYKATRYEIVGLLISLIVGCGTLPTMVNQPRLTLNDQSQLPPCVDDDCNCNDFHNHPLAQEVFEAFPGDPFVLDPNGDGVACNTLSSTGIAIAPAAPPINSVHLVFGNPTNAGSENLNNYLMTRSQYVLSYNSSRGIANWVSWQINADWLGETYRQNNFRQDGGLPAGVYPVTPEDYANTGYDRGHVVPSGDRTRNVQDNAATFLMTNVLPQAPKHNQGVWQELEAYSRDLVHHSDSTLFVIAGGYGDQARLANGRLTVPSRLWKILVILEAGQTPEEIDSDTQVIAVDIPNREGIGDNWRNYQTTVDRLELATGYDFLTAVPENIQAPLEAVIENTTQQ